MDLSSEFLDKFHLLYLDSFIANIAVGVLLGALGLFVILRRIVFLSAALSQVAGAGLALAFFIGAMSAHLTGPAHPAGPDTPATPGERIERHQAETAEDQEIEKFLEERGAKPKPKPAPVPKAAPAPKATPALKVP